MDAKREDFVLMFVGLLDVGRGPELTTLRCTSPLGRQTLTVENVVEATIAKFHFTSDLAEDDPRQLEAWLRRYVTQAFKSLLYVCTEQPDIEVRQPGKQRGGKAAKSRARRRSRPDDIETVVKLGFRMGPALHAARTRWNDEAHNRSPADSDGPAKRPHQKRGHYRTYWTGPGRTIPTVRWIAPFWVNEHLLNADTGSTEVVVRRVNQRP